MRSRSAFSAKAFSTTTSGIALAWLLVSVNASADLAPPPGDDRPSPKVRAPSRVAAPAAIAPADPDAERTLDLPRAPLVLRKIPKGQFLQGSPPDEAGREPDEVERRVAIGHPFWMGEYPVTRGQFAAFVDETHYATEAERGSSGGYGWNGTELVQKKEYTWRNPGFAQTDDHPVVLVTFQDADAFIAWASAKANVPLRLPTEAEWEYAARAGTKGPWYAATDEASAQALGWTKRNAGGSTHPVGKKKANPFGLFDMAGNVAEWCLDAYGPWTADPASNPIGRSSTDGEPLRRVLRGGSWLKDTKRSRSAARFRSTPGSRNADIGFRIVLDESSADSPLPGRQSATDIDGTPAPGPIGGGAGSVTEGAPPSAATGREEGHGAPLGVIVPSALAVTGIGVWLLRRKKRASGNAMGIATRTAADGFWVRSVERTLPAGTRVRYECIVSGVTVTDVVPLDGRDETFVYTGGVPSAVRVLEIIDGPAAAGYRGPEGSRSGGSFGRDRETPRTVVVPLVEPEHRHGSSSDFLGYPRAY